MRYIKPTHYEERPEKEVIPPLTTTKLPPQTPESSVGVGLPDQVYLPSRERASIYIQRFFEEVHCLFWLFSTEQFHARLHETYQDGGATASASWLCSLYSIFALGAVGLEPRPGEGNSSAEYLVLAKALVPQVCDEADVDSIRALCLLV